MRGENDRTNRKSSRGGIEINEAEVNSVTRESACVSAHVLHKVDPAADEPSTRKCDWCASVCACVRGRWGGWLERERKEEGMNRELSM